MVTASIYFDTRRTNRDGTYPLRLYIAKKGVRASMILGINLNREQWDGSKVINHQHAKILNGIITDKFNQVQKFITNQEFIGAFAQKSAKEILLEVQAHLDPDFARKRTEDEEKERIERDSFALYFQAYILTKDNLGTRQLYKDTYKKLEQYCEAQGIDFPALSFNEITKGFLSSFEKFCLTTQKQNTASRHLRDIRAVLNAAIDDNKTTNYPFRKFKIKQEESRDKSYSATKLRELFSYPCYPGEEQEAVDMLKLMFCLRGINRGDLANLLPSNIHEGKLEYKRKKTDKNMVKIKLEPEALEIIEKYKGETHLLNILERNSNYNTYFGNISDSLRKVGLTRVAGKKSIGKPIVPDICLGSARTSWATIAQEDLDIDRYTIAAALGHHTVDVTTTYLRTDWAKKADKANRKVLDWVLYGKRSKKG